MHKYARIWRGKTVFSNELRFYKAPLPVDPQTEVYDVLLTADYDDWYVPWADFLHLGLQITTTGVLYLEPAMTSFCSRASGCFLPAPCGGSSAPLTSWLPVRAHNTHSDIALPSAFVLMQQCCTGWLQSY